jgi:predicted permease
MTPFLFEQAWSELRYAARSVARDPGFTAVAIACLALGIGANTTMFGALDTLLFRPPPGVHDASGVRRLYFRQAADGRESVIDRTSFPGYASLLGARSLSRVAAFTGGMARIGEASNARQARIRAATASLFPLLGVRVELGRFFESSDEQSDAAPVAVVSHSYWVRELRSDTTVLARSLRIGSTIYPIVGVAPPGFAGVDMQEPDVWLPLRVAAPLLQMGSDISRNRERRLLTVVARLADGTTPARAVLEATAVFRRAASADGGRDTSTTLLLGPIQEARGPLAVSSGVKVALWIGAVALAVLLVSCANVAGLLLARGLHRRREMALRASLGAGRGRLVRQLLAESFLIAAAGSAGGVALSVWGSGLVQAYLLPPMAAHARPFELRLLVFAAALAVITCLLAGTVPALVSSRTDIASTFRSSGREMGHAHGRLRFALIVTQVAVALPLLVGAALFIRSLHYAHVLDYGLDLDHVLIAVADVRYGTSAELRVSRSDAPTGSESPQNALYLRLLERIRANPAVLGAAVSVGTPYSVSFRFPVRAANHDSLPHVEGGGPYVMAVSAGYFATVGTRMLQGREFTDRDVKGAEPVAVVGQTFARLVWPQGAALGQCLYVGRNDSSCVRVVGVATDARSRFVTEPPALMYYVPFAQRMLPADAELDGLVIRTRAPARTAQAEVQRALLIAEPGIPYFVVPLLDRVERQWRAWQMGSTLLTPFALLALGIAALGLYGVTAYGVTQRTQEIGVRTALGARPSDVISLSVSQAMRATMVGATIGVGLSLLFGRAVSSVLFGVKGADPTSVFAGVLVLLGVAALAAYLPARRAASISPMEALRYE